MTDLIQNVQDVYKKWESRGASNFNSRGSRAQRSAERCRSGILYSDSSYNRPRDGRFRQRTRAPFLKLPKYDGLAQFKMAPCVAAENKQRPFMGTCCSKCLPLSRASVTDARVFSLSVCNILHIPHFQSLDFSVVLNILKRNKKSSYPDISANVLKCESVLTAIEDSVELTSGEYEEKSWMAKIKCEHYNRVKIFLDSIKSSISSIGLYFSSFILHSVLNRTFNGILVHKGQLEILKAVSQEAVPMIYLPLHQSYMNSILISFIIFMNSMSVPLVPVDQDTCIPFVRYLLKFIGVFFVRNHLKNCSDVDQVLYSSVLQNYIRECLKVGYNFELFVDEDNSVPDHVHLDKYQLFPTIIESVLNGSIEDANICVVSISYEKFPSGNIVQEKLGQSEIKNSLLTTIYSLWKMIHMRFGNVRINFGQPFSIKEFIQTWKQSLPSKIPTTDTPPSSPINNSSAVAKQEFVELLQHVQKNLKKHLVYDAVFSTPLMSTHLLAFLLLTQYRKGATQQQLQNSMDWLRGLLANKKRDTGFTGQSLPVIKRAVEFLGKDLISSEVVDMEWTSSDLENNNVKITIYKPVINLPHVLELQHYASHVVPVFIIDSIVVNAIYALVDVEICHFRHCDSQLYVSRDKLIDKAIELSDLLEYEFVTIPPCSDLALSFSDSLDALIEKECLHSVGMNIIAGRPPRYSGKAHILSFDASDDEDDEDSDLPLSKEKQLKVDLSEESISHLEFLRNVLSPYIESYWLSAITLLKLIDDVKKESVFIQEMQLTAQEKLYKGLLGYEESFSAITFKNSLKLFESWHVVESYEQDGIKIVYLNENYNNKEQIDFIISKVEEFRK